MTPNLKVGTFSFYGVTSVPEPDASVMVAAAMLGLIAMARRKRPA